MTIFWDGQTDRRSDCTPRPAFAFGNAGKNIEGPPDTDKKSIISKICVQSRKLEIINSKPIQNIFCKVCTTILYYKILHELILFRRLLKSPLYLTQVTCLSFSFWCTLSPCRFVQEISQMSLQCFTQRFDEFVVSSIRPSDQVVQEFLIHRFSSHFLL